METGRGWEGEGMGERREERRKAGEGDGETCSKVLRG